MCTLLADKDCGGVDVDGDVIAGGDESEDVRGNENDGDTPACFFSLDSNWSIRSISRFLNCKAFARSIQFCASVVMIVQITRDIVNVQWSFTAAIFKAT
jgi:hypothetical protein